MDTPSHSKKIPVAILGATGSVGQKFVELLADHPWFEIVALCASERSVAKPYGEAARWFMQSPLLQKYAQMIVQECAPVMPAKIVFSGLDSGVAGEIETSFARAGYVVISNSKNHRWDADVPLIVPEINADHLGLLSLQKFGGGGTPRFGGGAIVTNPNCSTIGLVMALKPLVDAFGVEAVNVVTLQALSGAGYPGVPSLDILDNVVPYIGDEDEKIEEEPRKILGHFNVDKVDMLDIPVSAQANRVAVLDGHTECVQVRLKKKATKEEILAAWAHFKGKPQEMNLPTAPLQPIHYFQEDMYPQPKLHRALDKAMAVSIGRLRPCKIFDWKFVVLSHNTVRGAAGGTILIAEMMLEMGLITAD